MSFLRHMLFDREDRELAAMAQKFVRKGASPDRHRRESHPCGIVSLTEPYPRRMLRHMAVLLENGGHDKRSARIRLRMLASLRDELRGGLEVPLRYNTARVVLALLKELLRTGEDRQRALQIAHDIHAALLGNPRFIRQLLTRCRLVEMPETWRGVTFDEHVHDAYSKGRKSPARLLLDAWIKGIRRIQVIYYDFVPPEAADELLHAAEILEMDLQIGVEFRTLFRGRFTEVIWSPRKFAGAGDFPEFLRSRKNSAFLHRCRKASEFRGRQILALLAEFNASGRKELNRAFGLELPPLKEEDFLAAIDCGQPSRGRLGAWIAECAALRLRKELEGLRGKGKNSSRRREIRRALAALSEEEICEKFLPWRDGALPPENLAELPELNRLSLPELQEELRSFADGSRLTLNLSGLTLPRVIELLYACHGGIGKLEIFNLKDALQKNCPDYAAINELRHALNTGNVIRLKKVILTALDACEKEASAPEDAEALRKILKRIPRFLADYERTPLGVTIGSDSAGRSSARRHGMGFAVLDSLGRGVRKALKKNSGIRLLRLPLRAELCRQVRFCSGSRQIRWEAVDPAAEFTAASGNVVALGGDGSSGEFYAEQRLSRFRDLWHCCCSPVKIFLKIFTGFLAAQLTFGLNGNSWWVLAWFGAAIWLGITLVRNVIQLILSGRGLRFGTLLRPGELLSWRRIADSLFYTGLSVPLLDYLVKTVLLIRVCGLSPEDNPILLYAGIGVANGLWLTGHNLLRAFPRSAVLGNWLRVPLAIPLAILLSSLVEGVLVFCGVSGVEAVLRQWAAVISKLAGDCVGGVVEGLADRRRMIRFRAGEFRTELAGFFNLIARLELLHADRGLAAVFRKDLTLFKGVHSEKLLAGFYVSALDFMYFRLRQPRGATVLHRFLARATPEERMLFAGAQEVLTEEKKITAFFLEGALGENFRRALGFYLHNYRTYLAEIRRWVPESLPETPSGEKTKS